MTCKFERYSILIAYEFLHHPTPVTLRMCTLSLTDPHLVCYLGASHLLGFLISHRELIGPLLK